MRRVLRNFISTPTLVKTNFRGHYATVNHSFGDDLSYKTHTIGGQGLWHSNLVGVQFRIRWKEVEPTKASSVIFGNAGYTYDFSAVSAFLADVATRTGAGAGGKTQMYIVMEDRAFYSSPASLGTDCFPDYLFTEGYTTPILSGPLDGNQASSNTFRANPYVTSRYVALIQALANWRDATVPNGFDKHPNFEGVITQETAIGDGDVDDTITPYSPAAYTTAIKAWIAAIYQYFPRCRGITFINFITGGQTSPPPNKFNQILDYIVASAPGHCFGGPDVLHNNATLNKQGGTPEGIYQYYDLYKAVIDAAGSCQQDSYKEQIPGQPAGTFYTMTQQFNLAAALASEHTTGAHPHQLFCKRVLWDFRSAVSGQYDWSDAVSVINATASTFNIAGTVKA